MNYKPFLILVFLISFSSLQGLPYQTNQADIEIVGTISFLTDFTKELLGDEATYHSIIKGSQDPHFVEPSAEDLTKLQESDLIIAIGHEAIDEWILDFVDDNPSLAGKVVYAIDLDDTLVEDPVVNTVNPHFWLSPIHAKTMVSNIADELISRDLASTTVSTNLPLYIAELDELLSSISNLANEFNGTKVVEDHPAFMYFTDLLGLNRIGVLEEQEGVDPSPLHLQQLSDKMKEEGVELILASKIQAGSDVEELARMSGAKIAYLYSVPGNSNAAHYIDMIEYNLDSIQNPVDPPEEDSLPSPLVSLLQGLIVLTIIRRQRIIRLSPP